MVLGGANVDIVRSETGETITRRTALGIVATGALAGTGVVSGSTGWHPANPRQDVGARRAGSQYEGIVVFRADDPQPYWHSEALRDLTALFREESVPATYGVVPAAEGNAYHPGSKFCEYLRSIDRARGGHFELAMHGYTHEFITDWKGASEFAGLPYDRQHERLQKGKRAFERGFGRAPTTFIAPGNTYDRATARALDDLGFVVASGNALVADEFGEYGTFRAEGIYHVMSTIGMMDWTSDQFRSSGQLESAFDETLADGGIHVQMLHYQHFHDRDRLAQLRELLRYMKRRNVYFTTLGDLARGLQSGRIRQSGDGWFVESGDDSTDDRGEDDHRQRGLPDVRGHPFESAIRTLVDSGVITGYDDGTFRPERSVSRAEFAAMVANAFDLSGTPSVSYPDVDGHWAESQIEQAAGAGFFRQSWQFNPSEPIDRVAVIAGLASGRQYSGGSIQTLESVYEDASAVPRWAEWSVADAHARWGGIECYRGPDDGRYLLPATETTRAEAAKYVSDALVN